MSSNEWTPTVPGHTADLHHRSGVEEPEPEQDGAADDVAAQDVIGLDVERHGEAVVVRVRGEVDALTSPLLTELIHEQVAQLPAIIVLHLGDVTFLGSSGLAALIKARDLSRQRDLGLRLVCNAHAVLRPLVATGLADQFDIYDDLAAALD